MLQYMWVRVGHMQALYQRALGALPAALCVFFCLKTASSAYFYLCALKHYPEARAYLQRRQRLCFLQLEPSTARGHYALFKASSFWQFASYQARLRITLRILVLLYFSMSLQILITYSSLTSKNWKKNRTNTLSKSIKICNNYKKLHDFLHCETRKVILIKDKEN